MGHPKVGSVHGRLELISLGMALSASRFLMAFSAGLRIVLGHAAVPELPIELMALWSDRGKILVTKCTLIGNRISHRLEMTNVADLGAGFEQSFLYGIAERVIDLIFDVEAVAIRA